MYTFWYANEGQTKDIHLFIKIRIRKFKYIRIKRYYNVEKKKSQNGKIWNKNKGENVILLFRIYEGKKER